MDMDQTKVSPVVTMGKSTTSRGEKLSVRNGYLRVEDPQLPRDFGKSVLAELCQTIRKC